TPAAAVVVLCAWSAVLTFAGKFSELIDGVVFVGWIFYGLSGAAIFPLRAKLRRGGKGVPHLGARYPWTPLVFLVAGSGRRGQRDFSGHQEPYSIPPRTGRIDSNGTGPTGVFFLALVEQEKNADLRRVRGERALRVSISRQRNSGNSSTEVIFRSKTF